jgi:hypothetical protein
MRQIASAIILLTISAACYSQDSATRYNKVLSLPDHFFSSLQCKTERIQNRLQRSTLKYLAALERQEHRMKRHISLKDSTAAKAAFGDVRQKYQSLRDQLSNSQGNLQKLYSPRGDSMVTALNFLNLTTNDGQSEQASENIRKALTEYKNVQIKFSQTEAVRQQLNQRRAELMEKMKGSIMPGAFKKYQQTIFYYKAQLREYHTLWEHPGKLESKLLQIAVKMPAFRNFFGKYSELASVFRLPASDEEPLAAINGLQTRSALMQEMGGRIGNPANTQQMARSSINNAQSDLRSLQDKTHLSAGQGGDPDMPNFKPNGERTKSFWNRLDLGTNIQSTKSSYYFPTTTDIGVSIGYRLSKMSVVGIGVSYKLGWGADIRHIKMSHQGIGFRSFLDVRLKGNIWISGGAEMNYLAAFRSFQTLKNYKAWQQSGLVGLSKKYNAGRKRKGNIQLLYDFLHVHQVPAKSPFIFRTGYSL